MSTEELKTDQLIQKLAVDCKAKNCQPAWKLSLLWFVASLFSVIVTTRLFGFENKLQEQLQNPRFILEILLGFIVVVMAATCAIQMGSPGKAEKKKLLPIVAFAIWVLAVVASLWPLIMAGETSGFLAQLNSQCFETVFILAIVPGIILFLMIRKFAPTSPGWTGALATLAGATMGTLVLEAHCVSADYLHIMVGHILPVVVIMAAGVFIGRRSLRW